MDDIDESYEPMDIDLSSNSVSPMDISFIEKDLEFSPATIKSEKEDDIYEKRLNLKPITVNNLLKNYTQNRNRYKFTTNQIAKLVLYIMVVLFAVVTYQIAYFKCNESLNIGLLKKSFASKIYGQDIATEKLLKALDSDVPNKVITLYGGTGVGKTYTASLILENILQYGNTYHYTMPGFLQTSSDFMLGLIYCESSIIVIDDLSRNDILMVKDHIKDLITKSLKYSKKIMIILLYNCDTMGEQFFRKCDSHFLQELTQSLKNIDAHKFYIKYELLNEEVLRKCIKNELSDKMLTESDIAHIMKNFNVTIDGCKGVYQKMKYLSIV
ncbi:uncharacterized protein LOC123654295 [Melitaea cinxia]|uniref:uncharacterized protein LOC123654295 n=1 Tax=Melitaea cinxia TaxID=113334 RepID=UPI001E2719FA|nr:uncharacterized protein LOC123654295 [Melitaea cinxia]